MLRIAGEKITKVLDKLWSANSIIMWVNRLWLSIKKTKENKQNKKKKILVLATSCVGYSASSILIEQTVCY